MADTDFMDPNRRRVVPPPPPQFKPAGVPGLLPPQGGTQPGGQSLQPIGQPDPGRFAAANGVLRPAPGTATPVGPTAGAPVMSAASTDPAMRNTVRGADLRKTVDEQIAGTGNGSEASRANIQAQMALGGPGSYNYQSTLSPEMAQLLYEGGYIDEARLNQVQNYWDINQGRTAGYEQPNYGDEQGRTFANPTDSMPETAANGLPGGAPAAGSPLSGGDMPAWYTSGLDALREQLSVSRSSGERDIAEWAASRGLGAGGGSPSLVNFADLTGQLRASEMSGLADLEARGAEYGFRDRGLDLQERSLELQQLGIEKEDAFRWASLAADSAFRQKAIDLQAQGMSWDQAFRQAEQEWRQESELRQYGLQTNQAGFDQRKYYTSLAQWFVENDYEVPEWLRRQLSNYGR